MQMSIAIYGAGALGTVMGAYLSKAGLDVDLINRNPSQIEGLRKNGASVIGTVEMNVPVNAYFPDEMPRPYDLIFLLTKQQDNIKVVEFLSAYLKEDGVICTAQNGFPELSVAEVIGKDKTYGCTVAWGATLVGNGVSELTSSPDSLTFNIGTLGGNAEKLAEIKTVLEVMGDVRVEDNFVGARWSKLLINCGFSGMSSIMGCTFGQAAKHKNSRSCIQRIIKEGIDVANKAGIVIEPIQGKDIGKKLNYHNKIKQAIIFMIIPLLIRKHASLKASMLQDLEKGKKTEVDAINGIICQYGQKYGIPTPYNDKVVEVIHEIENGKYTPAMENVKLFDSLK